MDLARILAKHGVGGIVDKRVKPHPGKFHPVGVLLHHTATPGAALGVVQKGRSDLAGPLCNVNVSRAGKLNVVCDGIAWHAGKGSSVVLHDVLSDKAPSGDARARRNVVDNTDGNPWFIGFEVDNAGDGKDPYPDVQIAAIQWACAAFCKEFGWSENRVIHHREWTARKIDMSYRGPIRHLVAELL